MLTATVLVLSSFILAEIAFTALASARMLMRLKELPLDWEIALIVLFILGTIGDCFFNIFRGTFIFKELPKELLFTDRIQRHVDDGDWSTKTIKWVKILNTGEAGHIYVPEGFPND